MNATPVGQRPAERISEPEAWRKAVCARVAAGDRFDGLYARAAEPDDEAPGAIVTALLASARAVAAVETRVVPDGAGEMYYPSLTRMLPAASWYERAAHDLHGVVPDGHPHLHPLVLPFGAEGAVTVVQPPDPTEVTGRGMLTIPLGPVRSGVFESVEFLIETLGEDIPHVSVRPQYKHRGIAQQFEGRSLADGVLVAERVEGISSVAHALAYCHAVEALCGGGEIPPQAGLMRLVHAELERVANHLEVATRLAEAAGLAVAVSRFSWHKEETMRLVSRLCGNRFGRGVVVPGGIAHGPAVDPASVAPALRELHRRIQDDLTLAMNTPSFIDRLRTTGILTPRRAVEGAALGPVARASALVDDCRWSRPTDAYRTVPMPPSPPVRESGDVMARANVRWEEIDHSVIVLLEALQALGTMHGTPLRTRLDIPTGFSSGLGWAEAAQGETLYAVSARDGRIAQCFARSASFHNLALFDQVFGGDVFTDFAFIEASFGLGYAGAAM